MSIAAYLGDTDEFDDAVVDFAASYADVNDQDHAALLAAIESGRLAAEVEPSARVKKPRH